jgi:hypothetical protein
MEYIELICGLFLLIYGESRVYLSTRTHEFGTPLRLHINRLDFDTRPDLFCSTPTANGPVERLIDRQVAGLATDRVLDLEVANPYHLPCSRIASSFRTNVSAFFTQTILSLSNGDGVIQLIPDRGKSGLDSRIFP